jgi:hypothetical protein
VNLLRLQTKPQGIEIFRNTRKCSEVYQPAWVGINKLPSLNSCLNSRLLSCFGSAWRFGATQNTLRIPDRGWSNLITISVNSALSSTTTQQRSALGYWNGRAPDTEWNKTLAPCVHISRLVFPHPRSSTMQNLAFGLATLLMTALHLRQRSESWRRDR